jgi:hypothetical protein
MKTLGLFGKIILGAATCSAFLAACGGGGGGGGGGVQSYAGTWNISAVLLVNDCGLAIDPSFATTIIVNQDGERIVVNSGSRVLQGSLNSDDGFSVRDTVAFDNGCAGGVAYEFRDATDGEADVGVAMVLRCGVRQCAFGFGGRGTRLSQRVAEDAAAPSSPIPTLLEALSDGIATSGGEEARQAPGDSASEIADLVCPAS